MNNELRAKIEKLDNVERILYNYERGYLLEKITVYVYSGVKYVAGDEEELILVLDALYRIQTRLN